MLSVKSALGRGALVTLAALTPCYAASVFGHSQKCLSVKYESAEVLGAAHMRYDGRRFSLLKNGAELVGINIDESIDSAVDLYNAILKEVKSKDLVGEIHVDIHGDAPLEAIQAIRNDLDVFNQQGSLMTSEDDWLNVDILGGATYLLVEEWNLSVAGDINLNTGRIGSSRFLPCCKIEFATTELREEVDDETVVKERWHLLDFQQRFEVWRHESLNARMFLILPSTGFWVGKLTPGARESEFMPHLMGGVGVLVGDKSRDDYELDLLWGHAQAFASYPSFEKFTPNQGRLRVRLMVPVSMPGAGEAPFNMGLWMDLGRGRQMIATFAVTLVDPGGTISGLKDTFPWLLGP